MERESKMNTLVRRSTAILACALLAACAPGAWKPAPGFDGFLDQVQSACRSQRIGLYTVGDMLASPGSLQATKFIDSTSRLYFGKVTPDGWVTSVTTLFQGRASDPGVGCVLEQLRLERSAQGSAAPPSGR
jgi:hypothetical protein